MAYAPITKIEKFTGKEDDIQVWLNDVEKAITANGWNNARAFQAIPYFLQDTADLWYQSLAADYFTVPQILNQFIHGLYSSLLQYICPMHPQTFQNAVTNMKDFELAKLEANHVQVINLVMNRLSDLDFKLKQLIVSIVKSAVATKNASLGNLSVPTNSNTATKLILKQNLKAKTNTTKLEIINGSLLTNLQFLNTTIGILTMEFGHWKQSLTNNIPPATISYDKSLAVIFLFELEETTTVSLFNRAALDTKLITVIYIDAKVDGHTIKLILDSGLARAIKTSIDEIDDLSFEINNIIIPIKVLNSNSARMVDTHKYQPCVAISKPSTCQHLLSNLRKKRRNLSEKPIKCPRRKNLSGIQTKPGKPIITKTTYQLGSRKRLTKKKEKKKKQHLSALLIIITPTLHPNDLPIIDQNSYASIACDLIYNLPLCIIYTIPKEEEPISSCTSELESTFNPDSNSNNNDNKNNSSSFAQYGNKNNNDLESNSNPEAYITLLDLTKEQELK
ncbi:hypothetical protein G9A89_006452 [Geosiphon pyriformis]|nr:hypothetical protein G9A89_006452 [Geosiphon pyriformis]